MIKSNVFGFHQSSYYPFDSKSKAALGVRDVGVDGCLTAELEAAPAPENQSYAFPTRWGCVSICFSLGIGVSELDFQERS